MLTAARRRLELPEHFIEVERGRFLPWRIFDEILDLLRDNRLHPIKDVGVR